MIMKKITALIITAALLMSSSAVFADPGSDQADKAAPESMKLVAENEYLALYIDETTTVAAVMDKKNGHVWYTNPPNRSEDPIAAAINKDKLSSQSSISYYNPTAQQRLMNNYSDCIRYEQFEITPVDNGVRIVYRLGKEENPIISADNQRGKNGRKDPENLDAKTGKSLVSKYRLISLEKAKTEKQKQEMLDQFPQWRTGICMSWATTSRIS